MSETAEVTKNLPEALVSEIQRVTEILVIYKTQQDQGTKHLEFAIALMDISIRNGIEAAGSNDIPQMIEAYNDLKEYQL